MSEKIKYIIKKIWFWVRKFRYGKGFGNFGYGTIVRRPMRLCMRKKVFIGNFVDIMPGLRMECVTTWGRLSEN